MSFTRSLISSGAAVAVLALASALPTSSAMAQDKKPNIIVIMGDDIGWENVGAYHQGLMYNTTPNLDKLASEGIRFTDYYAEPSCTAGRANFITGELPIRTGLTTVGQAGAKVGMPDEAPTIATALKTLGAFPTQAYSDGYPAWMKKLRQSAGFISSVAMAQALQRPSSVRLASLRKMFLNLAKACSIGSRSGL